VQMAVPPQHTSLLKTNFYNFCLMNKAKRPRMRGALFYG